MTTYTLSDGLTVLRNPATDNVTGVDQTGVTLDLVVPDSTTSLSYTVDPLAPGDNPNEGNETVDVSVDDYNLRINGELIGSGSNTAPDTSIFEVKWTDGGVTKTSIVLVLFIENDPISGGGTLDADYIFVLDGAPLPSIGSPAAWNNFENTQLKSISIPTGAFGPGTDIPLNSLGGTKTQNDKIIGTSGNDVFDGGAGKDVIRGLDGDDRLSGGAANDKLFGGDGNDQLSGGNGNDLLNPGDNLSFDDIRAGKGNDTVDFSDLSVGYAQLLHDDLNRRIIANIDAAANTGTINKGINGTTTIINVENPILAGVNIGGLGIYGTSKGDIFNVTFGTDFGWMMLRGSAGNDTFNIGSGNGHVRLDFADAAGPVNINLQLGKVANDGFGNTDTIGGTGDVWEVRSSMNNDTVIGSGADESFILLAGTDSLNAGGGFDRLRYDRFGVDGVTVDLQAGTGTGVWHAQAFNHTISGIEWLRGSNGNDDLTGANGQNNRIEGRNGDDIIDGGDFNDTLSGDDGADDIAGGGGNDAITGGNGNDKLAGEAGRDILRGDSGNDIVMGGNGNDTLFGDGGKDRMDGGAGADVMNGGSQNDRMTGGGGRDKMLGGGGRDNMNGGAGNDTMTGGAGVDTFVFSGGDDKITDFTSADKINLKSVGSITGFADLRNNHTEDVGGNLVIDDGAGNTLTLIGVTEASLEANDFLF